MDWRRGDCNEGVVGGHLALPNRLIGFCLADDCEFKSMSVTAMVDAYDATYRSALNRTD